MTSPDPDDLKKLFVRIEKLVEIGVGLTTQKDTGQLMELILLGAKELTNADGGTLYLATEDQRLKFEIMHTSSLGFALGGSTGKPIPFPPLALYLPDGSPNIKTVVGYAALSGEIVNIPDAYAADGFDFSGTRAFDERTGYLSRSFLTVPMKDHEDNLIGVLQLINAVDQETTQIVPFTEADQKLVAALASQASVALTQNLLISGLKNLLSGLIQLVATAIDDKSPYTGGHCRRVPVITLLLADAASRSESEPFQGFQLGEKERYELEIAAWLHDCGKITTPEHVVDKATKLETICDRIQLVESRFEIARRDAEIALLRSRCDALQRGDDAVDRGVLAYEETIRQLEDDLAFLRRCNLGGEYMPEPDRERVRRIAGSHLWRSTAGEPAALLTEDEIENLTIPRGTLNDRERDAINNHVVATVRMLESLPLPRELCNVPEIAGGHHERVDGQGYPHGLKRHEMSIQARIMAIADVFEALTAGDRPYKKAKTLSETLRIMGFMKLEGHIDPDLFDLFVRERIYELYARDYMKPEQIDMVDPALIPGFNPILHN